MGKRLFFVIFGILIIISSIYFNSTNELSGYVITYVGTAIIIIALQDYPNWKFLNIIKIVILIPVYVLGIIGPLMKVLALLMFTYLLPSMIITIFLKFIPKNVFNIDLSYSANAYLALTFSLIFVTIFCEKFIIFFNKIINNDNPEELVDNYSNLTLHLINKARTKYLIFFSFFCYIIIYSVSSLNNTEIFEMKNTNVAIMQTFGTYIAFDRLISNKNLFILDFKLFLKKITKIWIFDFQKNNRLVQKD
jgi:hypothetical protein